MVILTSSDGASNRQHLRMTRLDVSFGFGAAKVGHSRRLGITGSIRLGSGEVDALGPLFIATVLERHGQDDLL